MRKTFSILLALALCATVASCAKDEASSESNTSKAITTETTGSKDVTDTTTSKEATETGSFAETTESKNDTDTTASKADGPVTIDNWVTEVTATHYATISIENYGDITVALDGKTAPATVNNFVKLANEGFYNGLTFHRIMEGFMMQGGDPNGNGTGGSSEKIPGEFALNGYNNNISHVRGAISMARSSAYDSASSQFFIVHQDSVFLNNQYAAFGFVTEGMNVVDAVCVAAQPIDNNGKISKEQQPKIISITIRTA